jgi:hypothetical protein
MAQEPLLTPETDPPRAGKRDFNPLIRRSQRPSRKRGTTRPAGSFCALLVTALSLFGCDGGGTSGEAQCASGTQLIGGVCQTPGPTVHVTVTLADQTRLLSSDPDVIFGGGAPATINIDVDPSTRYQDWVGVGAAVTDSAAWVLQHDLSASQRASLLADLFGSSGAGLGFLRMSIGASDFSLSRYTLDDVRRGRRTRASQPSRSNRCAPTSFRRCRKSTPFPCRSS